MFRRDPCNDNRKQAIVNEMVKSIETKGLIADARGKCWLIDRPDSESYPGRVFASRLNRTMHPLWGIKKRVNHSARIVYTSFYIFVASPLADMFLGSGVKVNKS